MGIHSDEAIAHAQRALAKARDRHQVLAVLVALRQLSVTRVAAGLIDLMAEYLDWSPLIADEVERLVERNPGLAIKQRLYFESSRGVALKILERQGHRWAVAALLTLHADGFVRERAIEEVARDRRGLPFIINRFSDWVPAVASAARWVITRPAMQAWKNEPADAATWRWAIESAHRVRGSGEDLLAQFLADPESRKLAMQDTLAARFVLESVTELHPGDPLVEAGLASPHGVVRAAVAIRFRPDLDSLPTIERLLRDPLPAVRIEALRMLATIRPNHPGIGQARLDTNFRVRSQARIQIANREASIAFYWASLPHPAAIEGVAETGKPSDSPSLLPYLKDSDPRVRRAAVRALAIFDTQETIPDLKECLGDPSARVIREVVRALRSLNATVEIEEVARFLSPSRPASQALLAVADLMPRWKAATFLLRYATTPELQESAAMRLRAWAAHMNVRRSSPRMDELAAFSSALTAQWVPNDLAEILRGIERPWRLV